MTGCPRCALSHGGDGGDGGNGGRGGHASQVDNLGGNLARGVLLGAVPGDVASLATLVAGLAGSVERATVGSGAVARDVAQLATGVALHGLSLAVAGKVVRTTALVAGGGTGAAGEATTAVTASVAATTHGGAATAHSRADGVGASALLGPC